MMPMQLQAIERLAPRVAAALARAEDNRAVRTSSLVEALTPFLQGIDEVLDYLAQAEQLFSGVTELKPLGVLIRRAIGDLEINAEAIFSGLPMVASNAMRDVMEIHYLLRDFLGEPERIGPWLTASNKARAREFGPGKLRSRFAAKLGVAPAALPDTTDYTIHSMFLHPTPWESARASFGISQRAEHMEPFILSWDSLHHAAELVAIVQAILQEYSVGSPTQHQRSFAKLQYAIEISQIARWADQIVRDEGS